MSKDGNNTELDEKCQANKVVKIATYIFFACEVYSQEKYAT